MVKLTDSEAHVLTELEGAPDRVLRESTLRSCAPYVGIRPKHLQLIIGRLVKFGFVEKLDGWDRDTPTWFKLTSAGDAALKAWQDDVPEMTVF